MEETTVRTFGGFEFDPASGELRRGDRIVPLQPQPARLLAAIVLRAGSLVPREELRDAVWGDATHVDFNRGLNYCVRHLRAALGDDARQPRFIETVARRGYRFIAPVALRRNHSARRPGRLIAGAAAMAAVVLLTLVTEMGGRNQTHHDAAVAVARAVHDVIF